MLSIGTLNRIHALNLDPFTETAIREIVQEAVDAVAKESAVLALQIPADWPADYFEQFYSRYPNKKDPKAARKALDKIAFAGKTRWIDLIIGLERYISSEDVQRGFVKHPTTFLNKGSWMNGEQSTPRRVEKPKSFFEIAKESYQRAEEIDRINGTGTDQNKW